MNLTVEKSLQEEEGEYYNEGEGRVKGQMDETRKRDGTE